MSLCLFHFVNLSKGSKKWLIMGIRHQSYLVYFLDGIDIFFKHFYSLILLKVETMLTKHAFDIHKLRDITFRNTYDLQYIWQQTKLNLKIIYLIPYVFSVSYKV